MKAIDILNYLKAEWLKAENKKNEYTTISESIHNLMEYGPRAKVIHSLIEHIEPLVYTDCTDCKHNDASFARCRYPQFECNFERKQS